MQVVRVSVWWLWGTVLTGNFQSQVFLIRQTAIQVNCESSLLQSIFTFLLRRWPVVVFVIIMAAKQEVAGRRSGMDGQVNQAQDFHI